MPAPAPIKKITKAQFDKIVAKHEATQDLESLDAFLIQVDAPKGKIWKGNGCHTICVQYRNNGGQSWKSEAYADAAETMEYGTELCDIDDCDMCEGT